MGNAGTLLNVSRQAGMFKQYTKDGLGYYGGSEGLVGSPADFYRFATMLLNDGVSPVSGRRVLSSTAVTEMTRNQVAGGGTLAHMPSAAAMGLRNSGFGLGVS